MTNSKPYRPNVGIALFNAAGRVLIGRRFRDDGPEIILPGLEWQMPQGGIDDGEDLRDAAMRELWEETGVTQRRLSRRNRLAALTSFRPSTARRRIGWRNFAASGRNGSRCALPARRRIDPLTPRNGQPAEFDPGAGSGSTVSPISSCRSAARSIAPWRSSFAAFAG